MGIGPFSSVDTQYSDRQPTNINVSVNNITTTTNVNPNPKNCCISQSIRVGKFLIVEINYPDCTNFEGKKILVYFNLTLEELFTQSKDVGIDPHFSNNTKMPSPIARFVPTKEGWNMAINFAQHII